MLAGQLAPTPENKCHNFRYGRNITERFGGDVMSGRTDYGEEDPGLDTVRLLVEEKKASVTKVSDGGRI